MDDHSAIHFRDNVVMIHFHSRETGKFMAGHVVMKSRALTERRINFSLLPYNHIHIEFGERVSVPGELSRFLWHRHRFR